MVMAEPAPVPPANNDPYGFILQDKPKPKRSFIPHWPKPILFGAALIGLLLVIIMIASFTGDKPSNYQQIQDIMARQQELIRVDGLAAGKTKDPNTKALAATATASLLSSQRELSVYLTENKVKYKPAEVLGTRVNKETDTAFDTAAKNNSFDATYFTYLKTNLKDYGDALKTVFNEAGPNAKVILDKAYQNNALLLSSPQLASNQ